MQSSSRLFTTQKLRKTKKNSVAARGNWILKRSATLVILNWPARIKTQPHDDRDNCFLPFDSKGPCGMTVNKTSMTIALLNTAILTPVTLIVRVSDRRDFIPQGALSCGNAIDQNGRFCLYRQRYHQDLSFPFASSFCRGQIHQW